MSGKFRDSVTQAAAAEQLLKNISRCASGRKGREEHLRQKE